MRMIRVTWQPPLGEEGGETTPKARRSNRFRLTPMDTYRRFEEMLKRTKGHEATLRWAITGFKGDSYESLNDNPTVVVDVETYTSKHRFVGDEYSDPLANLRAITDQINIARSAGLGAKDRSFVHRVLKPEPKDWMKALGLGPEATRADVMSAFRRLALTLHPDQGGTDDEFRRLILWRDQAIGEVSS